jgi:hypothetical protein
MSTNADGKIRSFRRDKRNICNEVRKIVGSSIQRLQAIVPAMEFQRKGPGRGRLGRGTRAGAPRGQGQKARSLSSPALAGPPAPICIELTMIAPRTPWSSASETVGALLLLDEAGAAPAPSGGRARSPQLLRVSPTAFMALATRVLTAVQREDRAPAGSEAVNRSSGPAPVAEMCG